MVRPCPPTMALPSAFASRVTLVGKTPNIFRESLSQTVGITTEKRRVLGTEAFEGYPKVVISLSAPRGFKTSIPVKSVTRRSGPHLRAVFMFPTTRLIVEVKFQPLRPAAKPCKHAQHKLGMRTVFRHAADARLDTHT